MRRKERTRCVIFIGVIMGVWLFGASPGLTAEYESPLYESPSVCASCHGDIHGMWENGMHAHAYDDPIFQASFLQAFFETKGGATSYCLRCHDPTSQISADFDVKRDIIGAGVTCDFCHTIEDIDLTRPGSPLVPKPGRKKTGPYRDSRSPVHDTERRGFFRKSEFCSGCHQLVGKNGVVVIGTYQEWKESSYAAEGVQCQDCHMPVEPGKKIVYEEGKRSKRQVNLHNLAGGHSVDQIRSAVKVRIADVSRKEDTLFVTVHVSNANSGHKIPTGTPSRQLVLKAWVKDQSGRVYLEREKTFQKVLVDDNREVLQKDHEIMLRGSRIFYDNRIGPKEVKEVSFSFTIPYPEMLQGWKRKLTIEAKAIYQYRPQILGLQPMVVEIAGDQFGKE